MISSPTPPRLPTRAKDLDLSRTLLMGVLNVTPDSFSDGGRHLSPDAALARAGELVEAGADMIDVGGESTRPGAAPVSAREELGRVLPVIRRLCERFPRVPVSVDTSKGEVARPCLEAGASIINDVTALADPALAAAVKDHGIPVVLMHMQGDPRTMQQAPVYVDVVEEIKTFFRERLAAAERAGISADRVLLDPGIGFGKTTAHNLEILRRLKDFTALGRPLVVGVSLKSFIGRVLGREDAPLPVSERSEGTLAAQLWAAQQGAHILRVHDVRAARRALDIWQALFNPPS